MYFNLNIHIFFSIIYNLTGERSRKTKLQTLSREFLREDIQNSRGGHCSIEDSAACMKLVKLKLKKSLFYGDAVMGGMEEHFIRQQQQQPEMATPTYATSLLKQITRVDKTTCVVALDDITKKYHYYTFKKQDNVGSYPKMHFFAENSNKAVIEKLCENIGKYSLNIAHIRAEKESTKTFTNIDKRVKKVFERIPTPGLSMVIFAGHKDGTNGLCFIQIKESL